MVLGNKLQFSDTILTDVYHQPRAWFEVRRAAVCFDISSQRNTNRPDFGFIWVRYLLHLSVCPLVDFLLFVLLSIYLLCSFVYLVYFFCFAPLCICLFRLIRSLKVATFRTRRQTLSGPSCRAYLLNWSSEELLIVPLSLSRQQIKKSVCVMAPGILASRF